ncbi:phenylalanyl-tRNA synthetase alpha chain [Catalinimonas alkaloidigena]|uniref:Phenylalanine--tRNA ligase alpha subunit n=1 Tax=Catalinimonas alkaloidigena TaxID=1075417 RepID=A0A1G9NF83_9BACT|nr:phenylalanine--tRNA ligase subunit alpha [Catalinimonas alkaloidigena]SDL85140.1 phenylalanyl-tRNA synthetase alpha chain [Catalinimonas alkaloidigena]
MMKEKIEAVRQEIVSASIETPAQLEEFRIGYVGRKGKVADLFAGLRDVPAEDRRAVGQELNELKQLAQQRFDEGKATMEQGQTSDVPPPLDLTLPVVPKELGARHPLSLVRDRIVEVFARIGFSVAEGPEIEDDWHNFSALNFPPDHPARDMQDTFFIERNPGQDNDIALRTHTSSVQVRMMERHKPPIRMIMPGRVFRNEAISARAHCYFHQVEGLYIAENVSMADLKQTLYYFAREMFGPQTQVRFRPSFFPFTEPSAEIDISCGLRQPGTCQICGGSENICKGTGWIEIGGAGMVDPNVLSNCGIDPERYTGFAFGMGIERITMIKYRISDIRLFSENDVRFLQQFTSLG